MNKKLRSQTFSFGVGEEGLMVACEVSLLRLFILLLSFAKFQKTGNFIVIFAGYDNFGSFESGKVSNLKFVIS